MSKHSTRACLIVNTRSSHAVAEVSDALLVLQAQGWKVDVRQKVHKGDATALAKAAADHDYHVVIACGGDGTVNEVVEGLVGTDVALGVLPGGTENVWAHEIGVSPRMRVAAMQLAGAHRLQVDVGKATVNEHHARHFLLMAGLGLDAAIMSNVSRSLKNRIGPLAVGVAGLEALGSIRTMLIRAEIDGVTWHGSVAQVVVGNTRRYGGFTRMTPDAFIDDGLLDLCLITSRGAASAARQAASLLLRQRPSLESAELYRGATVTIHASSELPLQLDGGAIEQKHEKPGHKGMLYEFTAVAGALNVLVPRTYSGELLEPEVLREAECLPNGHKHKDKGKKGK